MRWPNSPMGGTLARPWATIAARGEGRSIDRLAWPIIADGLFATALDLTNLALLGRLGTVVLSGVGASTQLIQLGIAAITGASVGGMVLAAQSRGARDMRGAGQLIGQTLIIGLAIGVALGFPALLLAHPLLRLIGASEPVAQAGTIYLQFAGLSFPALALMTVAAAVLRGLGNSRTPMLATGLVNVINISIAAFLIFGPPQLGVAGAAVAAGLARTIGAVVLLGVMFHSGVLRGARPRPEFPLIKRILGIGLPALGEQLILNFGLLGYGLIALQLGTTLFAAQRVSLTLIGLAWMPAFGYGAAITSLVGQAIGAGEPARARILARVGSIRAMSWMTGLAVVCFALADPLVGLFTADPAVQGAAATGLRVLCLGQPFWALGQVYAGALRGVGDTRFPMLSTSIGVWIVRLPVAWFFCLWLGLGLPGLFISNSVDAAIRALLVTVRFQCSRWQERAVARATGVR